MARHQIDTVATFPGHPQLDDRYHLDGLDHMGHGLEDEPQDRADDASDKLVQAVAHEAG